MQKDKGVRADCTYNLGSKLLIGDMGLVGRTYGMSETKLKGKDF